MACNVCNHASTTQPCRFCARPRRAQPCASADCIYCHEHTFASDDRALRVWNDNTLLPRRVWRTSSRLVCVKCAECGKETRVQAHRISLMHCALCANPNERAVHQFLSQRFEAVEHQVVDGIYRYDFVVDGEIVVEVDGPQHFKPVRGWRTGMDQFTRDLQKEEHVIASGRGMVRILQEDVKHESFDWRGFLETSVTSANKGTVMTPSRPPYRTGVYARLRVDSFF